MQRAAVAVPSHIAEGHGRKYTGADLNHLSIAHGSLMELETLLQLAERLGFAEGNEIAALLARTAEVGRMLNGLQSSLATES